MSINLLQPTVATEASSMERSLKLRYSTTVSTWMGDTSGKTEHCEHVSVRRCGLKSVTVGRLYSRYRADTDVKNESNQTKHYKN